MALKCLPVWMVHCAVLSLGTFFLTPAWAVQEVRVGAAHFPPYTVRPEIGIDTGLLPQLLDALNQLQADYHFVIVPTSNARRYREFEQGRMDMVLFENPTWGSNTIAHNPVDMGLEDVEVFVAKRQSGRGQAYFDDLANKRLALFNGYHYAFAGFKTSPQFLSATFNASLTYSHAANLQMVLRGRADIALITRSHLIDLLNKNPQIEPMVLVSDRVDYIYHHYALLSPQAPIKGQQLAKMLQALRDNGQYASIFAPYKIAAVPAQVPGAQPVP